MHHVRLASRSPRRVELLRGAGVLVEPCPIDCDESPQPHEDPRTYVARVALEKLRASQAAWGRAPSDAHEWLAADTIVWIDEAQEAPRLLGKPATAEEARDMLMRLGHTPHRVTTGWVLDGAAGLECHTETTRVRMRPLAPDELDRYLCTDAWRDKAGGYGIQAEAAGWVLSLRGSYTNVVGLPLAQVLVRLAARKAHG